MNKWLELLLPKRPTKHIEFSRRVLEAKLKALFDSWAKPQIDLWTPDFSWANLHLPYPQGTNFM